jgi:hypothetical protein
MRAIAAPIMLGLLAGAAHAQDVSGEITIWSWDVAASSLEAVAEGFMAANPGVTVTVEDLGNGQVFDRTLAGCAAGGADLPDVVTVENHESEIFWAQFPDCFTDLSTLGYAEDLQSQFPDFKRAELEPNGVAYAMPWDSGPVAMFYRRDMYEAAGVDPATIVTWDDFIAAGQKVQEANPDVSMTQANLNGDTEWFRMVANEQGCGYFSNDAQSITINGPGCVAALDTLKSMVDAGVVTAADWGEKITSNGAGTVAFPALRRLVRGHDPHGRPRGPGRPVGRLPDALRFRGRAARGEPRRLGAGHPGLVGQPGHGLRVPRLRAGHGRGAGDHAQGVRARPVAPRRRGRPLRGRARRLLGRPGRVAGHPGHAAGRAALALARPSSATRTPSCAPCRRAT